MNRNFRLSTEKTKNKKGSIANVQCNLMAIQAHQSLNHYELILTCFSYESLITENIAHVLLTSVGHPLETERKYRTDRHGGCNLTEGRHKCGPRLYRRRSPSLPLWNSAAAEKLRKIYALTRFFAITRARENIS